MFDIALEVIRALVVCALFLFLLYQGKKGELNQQPGWYFIATGYGLITFGSIIDITDNFAVLEQYIIIGDTPVQAFLEKIVGYLGGYLLFSFGFYKWFPNLISQRVKVKFMEKLVEELIMAEKKAQAASLAKSSFLNNIGHEFRTPLNTVLGETYLLRLTHMNEQQQQYVDTIHDSSQTLLEIISDVLEFSDMGTGKLELDTIEFKFAQLMDRVFDQAELKSREKGLSYRHIIEPNLPLFFLGDPIRLEQILMKLIDNAVKFTASGGISLSVKAVEIDAQKVNLTFCIKDTGIGLSSEEIEKLFSAFSQVDETLSRQFGGIGLGLSTCRRLAELMDGDIQVTSQPGEGSEFCFTALLSLARCKEQKTKSVVSQQANKRILLVEDSIINQQVTKELLDSVGLQVTLAVDGEQAVQFVSQKPFDLILMDLQMPKMDGYQACKLIRQDPLINNIPIIALSANAMVSDRLRCLKAGMNDHVAKPIEPLLLFRTLGHWLDMDLSKISESIASKQIEPESEEDDSALIDLQQLRGIDIESALARVAGNQKVYISMLLKFKTLHQNDMSQLQTLINNDEMAQARNFLHKLKGIAANLSVNEIHSAASILEAALEQKQGDIPRLLGILKIKWVDVMQSLAVLEEKTKQQKTKQQKTESEKEFPEKTRLEPMINRSLKQELIQLHELLEDNDAQALRCLDKLQQPMMDEGELEFFDVLKEQVDSYNFEQALSSVIKFEKRLGIEH